jgi:uncharacterized protein
MDRSLEFLWLSLLGLIAGGYGTIVGAGGGFIIAPVLLFMYPTTAPETITTISLAVVFANALSGTLAYAHSKRIDYSNGIIFSLAATPGAILGALTTTMLNRARFDFLFGVLMICVAVFLTCAPPKSWREPTLNTDNKLTFNIPNLLMNAGVSTSLGFISSFFGVGGGIFVRARPGLSSQITCPHCDSDILIHFARNRFHRQCNACRRRSLSTWHEARYRTLMCGDHRRSDRS